MSTESATLTVTGTNFMTDVVEASARVPVLVDFWAPWCGPCRQLSPILDRIAAEFAGRLIVAKVNTDEQPDLAQEIGIRSLPTVVLFKDRTVTEHFVGVLPEAQIKQLIEKHLPEANAAPRDVTPLDEVRALKSKGDFAGAREQLEKALEQTPDSVELQTERAELRALEGDLDGARQELERLQGGEPNHKALKRLAALLQFSDVIAKFPDVRALRERVQAEPDNLECRHALSVHQLLGGDVEPALTNWLDMLRHHRTYHDDLARRSLVLAFELIGEADPVVAQTRREMAKLLF
jgi:putative thioredoxin